MKLSFQRETFDGFYQEACPLLEAHKREIAHWQDIALDVDVDAYKRMEAADILRIYTARMAEVGDLAGNVTHDTLIGYAVFIVGANPHYRQSFQAKQDVFYVAQDHRGGRAGIGLLRFSEQQLWKEDVEVVYHHVKLAHPRLGRMLAREGYAEIERIFAKRIQ